MPRRLGTCQALKQCRLGVKNEEILGLQRGNASFAFAKFRMAKELSDGVQCLIATGNCCASPDFPGFANECSGTAWHSMARDGTEHKQTTSTFGCSFDTQTAGIVLACFPTQFSFHLTEPSKLQNLQSFRSFPKCFPESMSFARLTEQSERRRVLDQETQRHSFTQEFLMSFGIIS